MNSTTSTIAAPVNSAGEAVDGLDNQEINARRRLVELVLWIGVPALAVLAVVTATRRTPHTDVSRETRTPSDHSHPASLGHTGQIHERAQPETAAHEDPHAEGSPVTETAPDSRDGHAPNDGRIEADGWERPLWPVMINVLGTPQATRHGRPVKLTPQQLSALALIAIKREIPAHDFKRAIWGDEDDVSPERVRDMLSILRKRVGGLRVIPKREDGLVCAGPDLGSDLLVFDALAARSVQAPHELSDRLHEMLDLVTGRLFNYSSVDQVWWRWSELAFGMPDWTSKTSTTAETLARIHLEQADPTAARDIAERGLVADPLNAALTEILMQAHADLGALEAAQRVYESHDRSLHTAGLGGASDETRRVLRRLRATNGAARPGTASPSG